MAKNEIVIAGQNYKGILVRGVSYKVLDAGFDYYTLSVGGRPVNVPLWITERCLEQEAREREREEYSE
jgi:hypothetical protein